MASSEMVVLSGLRVALVACVCEYGWHVLACAGKAYKARCEAQRRRCRECVAEERWLTSTSVMELLFSAKHEGCGR